MKLKLIKKIQETEGVISFVFEPAEELTWKAGQFLHYVLHHEPTDDRGSDRWFTVSSAPFEKHIQITTRLTNDSGSTFKNELQKLEIGKSQMEISFLEGDFVLVDPNLDYVFVAGGIGITPFHSIIKQLNYEKKPINVTLLYANHDENIVFKSELEEIAKVNPNFKIHYVFSPDHVDEAKIKEVVRDIEKPIYFVSGPEPMVDGLIEMLKGMNIKEDHIKGDWFPGYKPF